LRAVAGSCVPFSDLRSDVTPDIGPPVNFVDIDFLDSSIACGEPPRDRRDICDRDVFGDVPANDFEVLLARAKKAVIGFPWFANGAFLSFTMILVNVDLSETQMKQKADKKQIRCDVDWSRSLGPLSSCAFHIKTNGSILMLVADTDSDTRILGT